MQRDEPARVERASPEAEYEVVAVIDRERASVRRVSLTVAVAALVVVAAVVGNLLGTPDDLAGIDSAVPTTTPFPIWTAATPSPSPADPEIAEGPFDITLPQMRIQLTMPPGWSSTGDGTTVYKPEGGRPYPDFSSPSLAVHDVTGVRADLCGIRLPHDQVVPIGPGVDDLATALATMRGLAVTGPTDVMLGGYPARRFGLDFSARFSALCGGPEGRWLWEDAAGSRFWLAGGTATVYVVDVDGERLVIATSQRGASSEDLAELSTIVESIKIEREFLPDGALSPLGNSLIVDGIPFSFTARTGGWAPGPIEKTPDRGFRDVYGLPTYRP